MQNTNYAIEVKGIRKVFGTVVANDYIDLNLKNGEILALLGENGSGKTTLMNMLSGIYSPDSGDIYINGDKVTISSPEDAKRLRIGMVHQHFKLIDNFTAADNIYISAGNEGSPFLNKSRYKKIKDFAQSYGFDIDPEKYIRDMSVGEKQSVEIIKVLYNGANILILDEPTAVLTPQETKKLFSVLRSMRDAGCAIIIITHKLAEVMELSDRVTILRAGRSIATINTAESTSKQLTELMVGHPIELEIKRPECPNLECIMRVENLSVKNDMGSLGLKNASFELHRGEILGIAGVAGSGQRELCEALAGLRRPESGKIYYRGDDITSETAADIIARGISMSYVPEDRLGMGLVGSLSITDNMMLKDYDKTKGPFVDRKKARSTANKVIERLDVKTPSTEIPVRRLSGGNVQKVLLGRETESEPNVLVTAYAVRGLDINSSYTIYDILNEEKTRGAAVLFVGEDLDVLLGLCDKIMVMCRGNVTGIVRAKDATKEDLAELMTDSRSVPSVQESTEETQVAADIAAPQISSIDKPKPQKQKKAHSTIHIVKRGELSTPKTIFLYTMSVLLALVLGGIFIALVGVNPFSYFAKILVSCCDDTIHLRNFIRLMTPLIITSGGIAIAFKMKFWNLGANGQFIMGAVAASTVAFLLNDSLPQWLTLLLMAIAGAVGGGIFGLIPAFCKVKFNTNESLLTLMLNYIALYFITYLKNVMLFRKVSDTGIVYRPDFKPLPESAWLYSIKIGSVSIDISFFIALAFIAFLFVYFGNTKQGYEISVIGDSINTARYAGMKVNRIIYRTMLLSAAVIGVAGMLQVSGSATGHTLAPGITNDVGWTGIIVAWLAKLNPIGILVVSVLLAILGNGSSITESIYGISAASSDILQAIILFAVLATDFFIRYKIVFSKKDGNK